MRIGQFLARVLGPRLWSRFSAKVIRGQGAIRQAGAGGRSGLVSGYNEPNGELVDFVVCTNCFKQDDLFLSFEISHKFKYDAIFEVDCTSPRTCQVPFQFVSMKSWMKCIGSEQFQRVFNSLLQIRPASY
jgi:hypothetical protein